MVGGWGGEGLNPPPLSMFPVRQFFDLIDLTHAQLPSVPATHVPRSTGQFDFGQNVISQCGSDVASCAALPPASTTVSPPCWSCWLGPGVAASCGALEGFETSCTACLSRDPLHWVVDPVRSDFESNPLDCSKLLTQNFKFRMTIFIFLICQIKKF